jgi:flagellar L-ring protein precursor FlgH
MYGPNQTPPSRLIIVLGLLLLSGCMSAPKRGEPAYAAVLPSAPPPQVQTQETGAIYQAGYEMTLYEDIKARRVGDILTVVLVEKTDAAKKAGTATVKDTNVDIANPTLMGRAVTAGGMPLLRNSLSSTQDFQGEGDSSQSNKLEGSITVSVAQVLPGGNLIVQGEKWIKINQGDEYVRLRGIVRQADIRPDNTVLSTQIGNAEISYGGTGQVASANTMGWLARFFLSAFWPF